MATVHSWGDAVMSSFAAAFAILLDGIPKIIGFLVILIVGWIVASIVAKIVDRILHGVRFDDVAQRSGFAGFVHDMGIQTDASGVVAQAAKWFIRLIFLVAAFDALGLPAISSVLDKLLLWLPNLVVALVVLVVAGLVANLLSRIVRGAATEAGLGNPGLLAMLTQWAIWGFAIIVAVNQVGIATTLVNTLFMGFVGALALAVGLAFGLGGRETAGLIVRNWYEKGQQAAPKMAEAAQAAQDRAQTKAQEMTSSGATSTPAPEPDGRNVDVETRPINRE